LVKVSLDNVSKTFGIVKALQDVTLHINDGELFLMVGPSGCGKTTALRIIAGFYRPDIGSVKFDNIEMSGIPSYKRNTGMVFQNYALWPHMNVYENITFGLRIRKVGGADRIQRVKRVLDIVKMREYAERFPNQLSGGQQQRVALARALVIEPSVLLLDEPLSNLDAKLRIEMRSEIRRIQRELSITTIYVTHDQAEALAIADRIAVLNVGRLSQVGSPREIYQYPESAFVASFMGEPNILDGQIEIINNEAGLARIRIEGNLVLEGRLPRDFSAYASGDRVSCFIRPETILGNEQSSQRFQVKVTEVSYQGQTDHYVFELPNGCVLRAIGFNPTGAPVVPGETMTLQLPPEKIMVLKQ
jgi:ABC-type Fe3+/spermidine/putrescine transport system ATPase subunit